MVILKKHEDTHISRYNEYTLEYFECDVDQFPQALGFHQDQDVRARRLVEINVIEQAVVIDCNVCQRCLSRTGHSHIHSYRP